MNRGGQGWDKIEMQSIDIGQVPAFWQGVISSIIASMIFAAFIFSARNIISSFVERRTNYQKVRAMVKNNIATQKAIFSTYNIVIAKTLKNIVFSLVYGSIGAIVSVFLFELSIIFYIISICFLIIALRWVVLADDIPKWTVPPDNKSI